MRVLAERAAQGALPIEVRAVISDQPTAAGLQTARELGIHAEALSPRDFPNRDAFDAALAQRVASFAPKLVVLAGYMRILNPEFVRRFAGRLLNIHPSLLPKHPGLHTHRRALESGDAVHGASVHFVTEALDAGPIIVQGRVPVLAGDDEAALTARVQKAEHIIYPQAVEWFAKGRLVVRDDGVHFDNQPLAAPPIVEVPA